MNSQISQIRGWISDYCKDNGKQAIIYSVSHGANAQLLHYIAQSVHNIHKFAFNFGTEEIRNTTRLQALQWPLPLSDGASKEFESGARMAVLGAIAKHHNGIVLGSANRSRIELIRYYDKRGDGAADIFPLGGLYYSEVERLLSENDIQYDRSRLLNHEKNLKLTWDDVEWASKKYKDVILADEMPQKTVQYWYSLTMKQKEVLSRMHQYEKLTRHKVIRAPINSQ